MRQSIHSLSSQSIQYFALLFRSLMIVAECTLFNLYLIQSKNIELSLALQRILLYVT